MGRYLLHLEIVNAVVHAHVNEVLLDQGKGPFVPNLGKSGVPALASEQHKDAEDEEAHEGNLQLECLEIVHHVLVYLLRELIKVIEEVCGLL